MPPAYVPDPNSPEAWAARLAAIEQAISQLKLSGVITQPVLAVQHTGIAGITTSGPWAGGWTPITNLTGMLTVGTRRVISVYTFVTFQKHTTKSAVELAMYLDGQALANRIGRTLQTIDGTTDDYASIDLGVFTAPLTAGTHTFAIACAPDSGTVDVVGDINSIPTNMLLMQDAGLGAA